MFCKTGTKDAPQCHSVGGSGAGRRKATTALVDGTQTDDRTIESPVGSGLSSLSDDVLLDVLLYCGPADVEEGAKLVNRRFRCVRASIVGRNVWGSIPFRHFSFSGVPTLLRASHLKFLRALSPSDATSHSATLWREFCVLTGKVGDGASSANLGSLSPRAISEDGNEEECVEAGAAVDDDSNYYRRLYFRNPCVPIDFATVQEALRHCPRTLEPSNRTKTPGEEASESASVVVMPGVYEEEIRVDFEACEAVTIRAAFPAIGATIVSPRGCKAQAKDQPCVLVSKCGNTLGGSQRGVVRLSHLRILHSSPGSDIWGGNAAVSVDRARVIVESCVLRSDSGRGLAATNQSVVEVFRTSIVDCAATGFYLGDWGSRARIFECNIVRNGFGSKRLRSPAADDAEAADILGRIAAHTRMLQQGLPIPREDYEAVPPGHSGVYVESSMCWIEDSLLAGNSLTGLSVVRGGFVSLSASDITENSNPILIEDAHDVRDATRMNGQGIRIRGGVVEGPVKNNFTSLQGDGNKKLFKGGVVRNGAPFFRDALEG